MPLRKTTVFVPTAAIKKIIGREGSLLPLFRIEGVSTEISDAFGATTEGRALAVTPAVLRT